MTIIPAGCWGALAEAQQAVAAHLVDAAVALVQRLPERVVQEDADLLMVYDNASMRMERA